MSPYSLSLCFYEAGIPNEASKDYGKQGNRGGGKQENSGRLANISTILATVK